MILEQHHGHGFIPAPPAIPADSTHVLLDPAIRDPAPGAFVAPMPANDTRSAVPLRPFAARPKADETEVRLVPLGGFIWGGTGPQAARVRGDHCLIRVTGGCMRIILPMGGVDHGPGSVIFVPAGTAFAARPQPGVEGQALLMPRQTAERLSLPLPDRMVVGAGAS
ncbi:MAG TPA: hypothetical protein PLL33_10665, partial [Paracoccus sp. (in: a-proteobacteria)]|nr:hypothetical protein [Paracoccus sp. (in: a-proteobacteria)]